MTYTGHYWDLETGMYFAPFRYLMPGAGRWLTRDPIGFRGGLNVYGYVRGNPSRYSDPLGLQVAECTAGGAFLGGPFGAAAGFVVGATIFTVGVVIAVDVLEPEIPISLSKDDDDLAPWDIFPLPAPPTTHPNDDTIPTVGQPEPPFEQPKKPNQGPPCGGALVNAFKSPTRINICVAVAMCLAAIDDLITKLFS